MELTFAPNDILQIDDARIIYRNFRGRPDTYNHEGDRNFALVIPTEEMAEKLREEGWNVKIKPAEEEGEAPFMYLPIKVKFNDRGPHAYLISGRKRTKLNEETVGCLDDIDIQSVDLDVRPYDWNINGKTGRTAYLLAISVTQDIDRFAARFAEEESPVE